MLKRFIATPWLVCLLRFHLSTIRLGLEQVRCLITSILLAPYLLLWHSVSSS